ncbi:MAG TPA: hypothetical protein VK255_04465, partial [Patescibacteria group bacterium]|nr:hypothetical protein [Patescibacteria group bacterium]
MNKKLIILLIFLSVFLMRTTASAATITSGDFSLEYNDPLFDVKNAAPGGEYSSGFSVHNTGSQAHDLQFKLNIVTDPEKLADFLFLKINETAGGVKNCLWGCSGNKKISQLNNSEIIFQNIFGGQKRDYEFILLFSPLAGNDLQNTKMTFDMTIGYFGQSPPTNPKNNNHHHNHHHHNNKP